MKMLVLAGSPRRESTARRVARQALDHAHRAHGDHEFDLLHLGEEMPEAFRGFGIEYSDETNAIVERVMGADAYVLVVPVYNGSYPAAFKNVFEFVDYKGLEGRVAGLVLTAGGEAGFLQVRAHVAQLMTYFNVHVVPRAVYVKREDVEEGMPAPIVSRLERLVDKTIATSEALTASVPRRRVAPRAR